MKATDKSGLVHCDDLFGIGQVPIGTPVYIDSTVLPWTEYEGLWGKVKSKSEDLIRVEVPSHRDYITTGWSLWASVNR